MASENIKRVRLGEVCSQVRGVSYKPRDARDDAADGYVPLLRANNISPIGLNHDELVYVRSECVNETQYVRRGDLLVCASSGSRHLVGKAAQVLSDAHETFGAFCKVVRPSAQFVEFGYLAHYFQSDVYRLTIASKAAGANINNIRSEHLNDLELPLPPLPAQRRIAAALDKISEMKRNAEARLQKLDLLVKARFNEMFERGVASMPPLRCDISSHDKYPVVAVGEVFQVGGPKRIHQSEWQDHGVPFLRISDLSERLDGNKRSAEHFISRDRYDQLKAQGQTPVAGDVLVTARGTLGRCYVVEENDEFYFQDGMITWLSHRSEKLDLAYFLNAMKSESFKRQYEGKMPGSTVAYLSIAQLAKLKLPLPPLSLQRSFAAFVEKVEALKATAQASLDRVDLLYRAKLQEYFG